MSLKLVVTSEEYTVHRFPPDHALPALAPAGFCSIVRTRDELSVICGSDQRMPSERSEPGWRLFVFEGPLPFTLTGVLASVLTPLAQANIGVLALSSYDTDYVLVKALHVTAAARVLRAAGHTVIGP